MRLLLSLATVTALACASAPVRKVGELRSDDPVWLKAGGEQVRYLGAIELPAHLGIEKGFFARLWTLLSGEDTTHALYRPFGVAVSKEGFVAVADPGVHRVRLFLPSEQKELELQEGLTNPLGVAFVGALVVVADGTHARLLAFDVKSGAPTTLSWKLPTFSRPTGLAFDEARQRLFVVDATAHCVHVVSTSGAAPMGVGTRGEAPGEFNFPTHVAVDPRGHLYVADSMNFRVQHFDEGLHFVRALGGLGDTPGDLPRAKGLAVDAAGTVWVVEGTSDVVQGFDVRGELVGVFGGSGVEPGRFWLPAGLTADSKGRLYVADTWNGRVQVFGIEPAPASTKTVAPASEATPPGPTTPSAPSSNAHPQARRGATHRFAVACSRRETCAVTHGRRSAGLGLARSSLAGARSSLAGARSSLEGAHPSLEGAHPSLEGAHPSLEGARSSLEGAHPSLAGAHPSLAGARSSLAATRSSLAATRSSLGPTLRQWALRCALHVPAPPRGRR